MTNPLDPLIADLEAATEGSRGLDLKIECVLGRCDPSAWLNPANQDELAWHEHHDFGSTTAEKFMTYPLHYYTTSLDSALTLVPSDCNWTVDGFPNEGACSSCYSDGLGGDLYDAPTAALAVVIAALRARAAGA